MAGERGPWQRLTGESSLSEVKRMSSDVLNSCTAPAPEFSPKAYLTIAAWASRLLMACVLTCDGDDRGPWRWQTLSIRRT